MNDMDEKQITADVAHSSSSITSNIPLPTLETYTRVRTTFKKQLNHDGWKESGNGKRVIRHCSVMGDLTKYQQMWQLRAALPENERKSLPSKFHDTLCEYWIYTEHVPQFEKHQLLIKDNKIKEAKIFAKAINEESNHEQSYDNFRRNFPSNHFDTVLLRLLRLLNNRIKAHYCNLKVRRWRRQYLVIHNVFLSMELKRSGQYSCPL